MTKEKLRNYWLKYYNEISYNEWLENQVITLVDCGLLVLVQEIKIED